MPADRSATGSYLCMFAHSSPDNDTLHGGGGEKKGKGKRRRSISTKPRKHQTARGHCAQKTHVESALRFTSELFVLRPPPPSLFEECALSARRTTRPPRCDVRQPGHLPGSVSAETQDNKPDFAPGREKKTQRLVAELSAGGKMLPGPLGRKRTVAPTHWPDSARIH